MAASHLGIDITQPLTREQAAEIEKGMDQFGVMVFHDQRLTDETQMAFSRNFGELELATAHTLREDQGAAARTRTSTTSPTSTPTTTCWHATTAGGCSALGTRLWHSDSSLQGRAGASISLLSARVIPSKGGKTEFADMRAAYDALRRRRRKAECEGLVCEHSQLFSRAQIGFTDFTEEERRKFAPVQQRLVRAASLRPAGSRCILSSHAGTIVGWPVPEARAFLRDLIEHATQREVRLYAPWQSRRPGDLGQSRTMHRGAAVRARRRLRDMHRTTVAGMRSTMAEAA